jgi:hypothetical protein
MLSYSLNYLAAFNISWVVTPPPINNILSSSDYLRTLDFPISKTSSFLYKIGNEGLLILI